MDKVLFKIVTPEGIADESTITFGYFPSPQGEVGVLPNHSPTLISLDSGNCIIRLEDGSEDRYFVRHGLLRINPEEILLITPFVDRKDHIDKKRAEESKRRAEERLTSRNGDDIDKERARHSLRRAIARLKLFSES